MRRGAGPPGSDPGGAITRHGRRMGLVIAIGGPVFRAEPQAAACAIYGFG